MSPEQSSSSISPEGDNEDLRREAETVQRIQVAEATVADRMPVSEELINTDGERPIDLYRADQYNDIEDLVVVGDNKKHKTFHRPDKLEGQTSGKFLSRYELEQIQANQDLIRLGRLAIGDPGPSEVPEPAPPEKPKDISESGYMGPVEQGKEMVVWEPPVARPIKVKQRYPWREGAGNYVYNPRESSSGSNTERTGRYPLIPRPPRRRLPSRPTLPSPAPPEEEIPTVVNEAIAPKTPEEMIFHIQELVSALSELENSGSQKTELLTPVKKRIFSSQEGALVYPKLLGVRAPEHSRYTNLTKDLAGHKKVGETKGWYIPPIYAPNDRGAIPRIITSDGKIYENIDCKSEEDGEETLLIDDSSLRDPSTMDPKHIRRIMDELTQRVAEASRPTEARRVPGANLVVSRADLVVSR